MQLQEWINSLKGTNLLLVATASLMAIVLGGMLAGVGRESAGGGGAGLTTASTLTVPSVTPAAVSPPPPLQSAVPMPLMAAASISPLPPAPNFAPPIPSTNHSIVIGTCNGQVGSANLRQFLGSAAPVVSVVGNGDTIQLTGQTAEGSGDLWYEAIAPSGQRGWIAGCFVGG